MKFTEEDINDHLKADVEYVWRERDVLRLVAIARQLREERDSRTAEIREYLRQCEGNAEDNIEGTTANEFLEWNAVAGALHDILREFDRRWPTK